MPDVGPVTTGFYRMSTRTNRYTKSDVPAHEPLPAPNFFSCGSALLEQAP